MKLPNVSLDVFYKVGAGLFAVIFVAQIGVLLVSWPVMLGLQVVVSLAQACFSLLLFFFFAGQIRDGPSSKPLSEEEIKDMFKNRRNP